ncbi:MAG TPA: hypothetical protein GX745_03645 [Clostridiales bacterium]|nr:hypothetical protein [Clostridiales bacterium]
MSCDYDQYDYGKHDQKGYDNYGDKKDSKGYDSYGYDKGYEDKKYDPCKPKFPCCHPCPPKPQKLECICFEKKDHDYGDKFDGKDKCDKFDGKDKCDKFDGHKDCCQRRCCYLFNVCKFLR